MSTNAVIIVKFNKSDKGVKTIQTKKKLLADKIENFRTYYLDNEQDFSPRFPKIVVNGTYGFIYHHWDGHNDSLGDYLREHYNTQEKAENLIGIGNTSTIIAHITPYCVNAKGKFDKKVWEEEHTQWSDDFATAKRCNGMGGIQHAYLFVNGKWRHYEC